MSCDFSYKTKSQQELLYLEAPIKQRWGTVGRKNFLSWTRSSLLIQPIGVSETRGEKQKSVSTRNHLHSELWDWNATNHTSASSGDTESALSPCSLHQLSKCSGLMGLSLLPNGVCCTSAIVPWGLGAPWRPERLSVASKQLHYVSESERSVQYPSPNIGCRSWRRRLKLHWNMQNIIRMADMQILY